MAKTRVGIVGCGNISGIYLKNLSSFEHTEVLAVADIDSERAKAKAEEYGIARACSPEQLLADPAIDIAVNLTVPKAHVPVSEQALRAGKHVYVEKPLGVTRDSGRAVRDLATAKGLRIGAAPDTFLGGGIQTCLQLIREGAIGEPVGATAFMLSHGPEGWHPDPEFYYEQGGGPMLDMGPYYLTALVALLGPIRRVTASARISFPTRIIGSEKKRGKVIHVEVPTHIAGVMDFASGVIGTLVTSFDVWSGNVPRIEIYGSEGTLCVPDPNTFGGPVRVRSAGETTWREVELTHGYAENARGLGVAEMAAAIAEGRPQRCGSDLCFHVLDVMEAFHDSSREGRHIQLESACAQPEPLPCDFIA